MCFSFKLFLLCVCWVVLILLEDSEAIYEDVSVLCSLKSLLDISLLAKEQGEYCLGLFSKYFLYGFLSAKK